MSAFYPNLVPYKKPENFMTAFDPTLVPYKKLENSSIRQQWGPPAIFSGRSLKCDQFSRRLAYFSTRICDHFRLVFIIDYRLPIYLLSTKVNTDWQFFYVIMPLCPLCQAKSAQCFVLNTPKIRRDGTIT
jgi:hypothetical protein